MLVAHVCLYSYLSMSILFGGYDASLHPRTWHDLLTLLITAELVYRSCCIGHTGTLQWTLAHTLVRTLAACLRHST
jgi:hypothetical protein